MLYCNVSKRDGNLKVNNSFQINVREKSKAEIWRIKEGKDKQWYGDLCHARFCSHERS